RRFGAKGVRAVLAAGRAVLGCDPPPVAQTHRGVKALAVLVAVTAVWGVTFVQVKDAVAIYPLFAFLGLRFGIASCTLAAPAWARLKTLGREGTFGAALAGSLLGA